MVEAAANQLVECLGDYVSADWPLGRAVAKDVLRAGFGASSKSRKTQ
jgi:hypothetical protein